MDFYGGWKTTIGDIGLDIGTIYYYYPRAEWNGTVGSTTGDADFNNWEVYVGASWKWLSAKFFYALATIWPRQRAGGHWSTRHRGTARRRRRLGWHLVSRSRRDLPYQQAAFGRGALRHARSREVQ
jgi:hypothetical protein